MKREMKEKNMEEKYSGKLHPAYGMLGLLVAVIFTACSSNPVNNADFSTNESAQEEAAPSEEVLPEEEAEEKGSEEEITTVEEPISEAVIYEGIDMESTLPGEQWVASFQGIIEEPKLIVFNDVTNKKIILEEGQEVDFSPEDKIAIYVPEGHNGGYVDSKNTILTNTYVNYNSSGVMVLDGIFPKYKAGDAPVFEAILKYDNDEMIISATLNITE